MRDHRGLEVLNVSCKSDADPNLQQIQNSTTLPDQTSFHSGRKLLAWWISKPSNNPTKSDRDIYAKQHLCILGDEWKGQNNDIRDDEKKLTFPWSDMTATQIRGENLAQGQLYKANGLYIPHNFKPCRTLQFAPLLTSNQVIDVLKHFVLFLIDNPGVFAWSSNVRCYHGIIECCSFIPAFSFLLLSLLLYLDQLRVILVFLRFS